MKISMDVLIYSRRSVDIHIEPSKRSRGSLPIHDDYDNHFSNSFDDDEDR